MGSMYAVTSILMYQKYVNYETVCGVKLSFIYSFFYVLCMFELHCNFIAAIVGDDDNMQVRIIATVIVVVVMFLVAIIIVAVLFFRRYILQQHIYPTELENFVFSILASSVHFY